MLMPRKPRDPNRPRPQWKQRRHYSDHLGNPVVLEEYVELDYDPEPTDQVAIQVYSTLPLDEDHSVLRDYLLGSWLDENPKPLFEIYSYCPPDVFACIEHNRREIASRKRQHIILGTPDPAPLIPQFFHPRYHSPMGCCILLNSHSYRLGYITDAEAYETAGAGPDWLYFNRNFSHRRSDVDNASRISRAQYRRELYPEGFETEITRTRQQDKIGYHLVTSLFFNCRGFGSNRSRLHYGLELNEGEPHYSDPLSSVELQNLLDEQFTEGNFALEDGINISRGHDSSVTVATTVDGAIPDLQYLLYVPFLSHLTRDQATALLESTSRLFTAALLHHLPATKTLHLEFRIPESATWSTILPAHRDALRHHEGTFPIGALHTLQSGDDYSNQSAVPQRVSPQRRSDELCAAWASLTKPYRVFAVVLDKPQFVRQSGVCFYMTDYDTTNEHDAQYKVWPSTQIWRSAGMHEVARRLAMLAVEEAQSGIEETRNLLPPE